MFWFSLSWNWQIFLGASPLQFHSYHRGFSLLSFIRLLCIFCRNKLMSVWFCWCCSRPWHTWAHHLCPRCATMDQHRLRPHWAWPFSLLGYFWQKCPAKCPCSCPHCVVATGQVVELWKHSWSAQHTPPQWQPKSSCDSRVRSTPCDGTESAWDTHLGTQHLFSMECPDSLRQSIPWYLNREHCR